MIYASRAEKTIILSHFAVHTQSLEMKHGIHDYLIEEALDDKLSRVTFTLKKLPHNVLIRLKKNQCRKHRPRTASSMGSHNKYPFAKISFD